MKLRQWQHEIKESATLAINQKVKEFRCANQELAHLGFGESPFPIHHKIQQALADNRHQKSYLPGLGLLQLRTAIANFQNKNFGHKYTAQDIAIGPGSKELLFQTLMLLDGDVLIPSPSWVSYRPQAIILNKKVILISTSSDTSYKITQANLKQAVKQSSSTQRILLLNSPNNPTGQVYTDNELQQLAKWCQEHNIIVISDEIYSMVSFGDRAPSIAKYLPNSTIVTSGLSKAFSGGGYRLGFLATHNETFIQQLATLVSETFSCVSSPIQFAACVAYFDSDVDKYVENCTTIHRIVLNYSALKLRKMGLNCLHAKGGFYLFPDFIPFKNKLQQKNILSSKNLTLNLLNEVQVAVLPSEDFSCCGESLAVRMAMVDYAGGDVYKSYLADSNFQQNIEKYIPVIAKGFDRLEHWLGKL